MKKDQLSGLIAAPFTPMNIEGEINLNTIPKYAELLIANGLSGAFVCGTTGEGPSLTTQERRWIAEEWIRVAGDKLKIIVHIGGSSQPQCIELAEHAQKIGAYAVSSIAPYFFKPETTEDLIRFFKPVAASASNLPFYYYYMPSMSGVFLPVRDFILKAVKEIPNFSGIKFTHFDLVDMQQCIELSDNKLDILNGFDELLICGLSLGTKAAVGSTYNYMPSIYMGIQEAFNKNDLQTARKLQYQSIRFIQIVKKYGGAIIAGKAIMEFLGVDCGPCRPPLRRLSDAEKVDLKKELTNSGFFMLKYSK